MKSTRQLWSNLAYVSLTFTFFCTASIASAQKPRILSDISYRPDATDDYQRERCKLDLHLPAMGEGFATIVWFHGGGLRDGHKADEIATTVAQRFVSEGIAVASPNYRLHPHVEFPAYVEDAAAAVAFVRRYISDHGGDAERVFVSGHSAGGYLASMIGLDPQYLAEHNLAPTDLAGFIPVSGQTITHSTVREERGIPRTRLLIDRAAPGYFVSDKAPRFLCIVGGDDLPIRAEENRLFVAAMKAAGHGDIQYLEVPERDHGTVASRIGESDDVVAEAMIEFMNP